MLVCLQVGDLSRKYGMLSGKETLTATYTDFNLPLFGINSVMGRSIVIHKDETGGPRWVCANIKDTVSMTVAMATFTFPVIGHVLLQQHEGAALSETSVYVELDYGDGTTTGTTGHSWAVHANPVGDDMLFTDASARCASAGGVFDPTTVNSSGYDTQCKPSDPLRCQLGDLEKKLGPLAVRGTGGPARAFFTDVHLPLQGPRSVVGKALVLKAASGASQTLACANMLLVRPLVAEARNWGDTQYGTVTFTQRMGVLQEPTRIDLDLRSMPASGQVSYRVDTAPAAPSGERCASLGGAFNPFEVIACRPV